MLQVIPKRWFSSSFFVMRGAQQIADIDISWWREKGQITVEGATYAAYRERLMSDTFVIELAGSVVARAEKTGLFQLGRNYHVEHAGRSYMLRAKSPFQSTLFLLDGEREIGTVSTQGIFRCRAVVDLPDEVPLAVRVLVIWLALLFMEARL